MKKTRIWLLAVGLVSLLALTGSIAIAGHSWEGFHWSRAQNPAALEVVDSVVGEWDSYLPSVVSDWNGSSVLSLTTTTGPDSLVERTACLPLPGKIRVCNAKYADPTWLGLATVWLNGDHIVQATAQVNDTWFDTSFYNDPNAKRHVLCQEVGHDFGLDHSYVEPTCMDDIDGLFDPAYVSPGSHDFQELASIYQHLDGSGGGGGKKGGNGGGKGGGNGGGKGGKGHGSDVRVWEEGDLTVVQFVLLPTTG